MLVFANELTLGGSADLILEPYLDYALWLARLSIRYLTVLWPVGLAVCAISVLAIWSSFPRKNRTRFWLPFAMGIFPIAYIAIGTILVHQNPQSLAPRWPAILVSLLLVLQVVASVALVIRYRDHRWFAAGLSLVFAYLGLITGFVATMSVSNDWL